jgi:hypothetical protein
MSTRNAVGDFSALATNGAAKTAFEKLLANVLEAPGGADETTLTIATGAVVPTGYLHVLDTEAAAATDDLTNFTVTNHPEGRLIGIRSTSAARVITLKHAAGGSGQLDNLDDQDIVLGDPDEMVYYALNGTTWREVGRTTQNRLLIVEDHTEVAASPYAILASYSGNKVYTNRGIGAEGHYNLPAAAAGLGPYTFCCVDADGIQVNAVAGDTIRLGGSVSSAGGNISTATIGDTITIICLDATEWYAIAGSPTVNDWVAA